MTAHSPSLRWRIVERPGGALVEIAGHLDENADLAPLAPSLAGEVELHLAAIQRVNSTGIREWVRFIHDLPSVTELSLSHCSPAIVTQLNTIYNFRGRARVRSLLAPYVCEACGIEEYRLLDAAAARAPLPSLLCVRCGGPMEFDDLPERYLSFLKETAP